MAEGNCYFLVITGASDGDQGNRSVTANINITGSGLVAQYPICWTTSSWTVTITWWYRKLHPREYYFVFGEEQFYRHVTILADSSGTTAELLADHSFLLTNTLMADSRDDDIVNSTYTRGLKKRSGVFSQIRSHYKNDKVYKKRVICMKLANDQQVHSLGYLHIAYVPAIHGQHALQVDRFAFLLPSDNPFHTIV
ncbi:hypothetical protein J6590_065745 [Homalodisca vitripennis]|nr:hypothetical protein J6590_065745 [Homalodisca vitripennis]